MEYSITALATITDCDALLTIANLEQDDLDLKKRQEEKQYRDVTTGFAGVDAALSGLVSEIAGLETSIAGMPEGPTKQSQVDKLEDLKHKKYGLEKRKRRYGTLALLQKENVISSLEKEMAEKAVYIDAVTQRKNDLAKP